MNIEDYHKVIERTEPNPEDYGDLIENLSISDLRFHHGVVGLQTEAVELYQELGCIDGTPRSIADETGDCLWYAGLVALSLGTKIEGYNAWRPSFDRPDATPEATGLDLIVTSGSLLDASKKLIFCKKPYDKADMVAKLDRVFWNCKGLLESYGYSIEGAMELNRKKLEVRFKSKFDPAEYLKRDKKKEAKVFS